jgi:alpha-glucosidase
MLEHYRRALAFRRRHPALRVGAQTPMVAAGDLVGFVRIGGGEQVFVAANLGDGTTTAALPPGEWRVAGQGLGVPVEPGATEVRLGPWELCLLARAD